MTTLDDLLTAGGKSLKFETPGDTYTGTVVNVTVRQATEFGTGKPLTFDNGDPREQIVIALDTDLREDGDDDGARSLYVKGWGPQRRAFLAAVKAAGGKPEPGDRLTVTFTEMGERPASGGFPAKLYEYSIDKTAKSAAGDNVDADTPPWETTKPPAVDPAQAALIDTARRLADTGALTAQQIADTTGLPVALVRQHTTAK